jgi:hypothetical protein
MIWYVFFAVLYLVSLSATLAFVYSAGVLNARADRLTEELVLGLRRGPHREAA